MNIMNKREMEAFGNKLSHIVGELTALCALTETVKDAVEKQDDPYAASVHGIHVFMCGIMEALDDAADSFKEAAGV